MTYRKILNGSKSSATRGRDEYPDMLIDAFKLLVRESGEYDTVCNCNLRYARTYICCGGRGYRGRSSFPFTQQGRGKDRNVTLSRTNTTNSNEVVPGTDRGNHPNVTCFGCQFVGYYRNTCPYATLTGTISMHVGCTLDQRGLFDTPDSWLLLDMWSPCDVTHNPKLFRNIKECSPDERLTVYCNGGAQIYNLIAKLNLLPIDVHFKRNSMENIVSMKTVTGNKGVRITLDTKQDNGITLTLADGYVLEFKPHANGLYYIDINYVKSSDIHKQTVTNYSLLQTVENNKTTSRLRKLKERICQGSYKNSYFTPAR